MGGAIGSYTETLRVRTAVGLPRALLGGGMRSQQLVLRQMVPTARAGSLYGPFIVLDHRPVDLRLD